MNTHLGCGSGINYILLENSGAATNMIDLEITLHYGEILSPSAYLSTLPFASFSTITAGLLMDTGYYDIVTANLDSFLFGKG